MALSISDHCRSCITSLQEVISILSQPGRSDNHVKTSQVCDELDRFSLFIGNIGALHRPESSLSIESRLQDANDVLIHILSLLADLNDVTAELLDIVSGKREGMVTIADQPEKEGGVISEANELREEISETITRLFRVSILIRQAAPIDIFAKALSRNRYHFSDQFDIAHVGEKYRKLATEDYAWLRQRLGRAITQRRHYLSYIHDHREKLGVTLNHDHKADSSAAKSQALVVKQPLDPKPMLDTESRPSFFTKATTIAAERITPHLNVAGDSDPDEDARSYTTVSRSIDGDHESPANIRIPRLDTLRADNKNEFECPFCFRIKKIKSERIWRKHVFSDLRPYVCTFPDCDAPYFGDINKWFHHEMTFHRVTYNCFLCQKVYYKAEKYLSHLRQEHGETLNDGGAQIGTDLARKPLAQIPASDCPCCSDWTDRLKERIIQTSGSAPIGIPAVTPTMFKRHLAAHLEQLALFAVPIAATTDDNKDSNAATEETRSKHTNTSQVSALTFPSFQGDFDDSSLETEINPSRNIISQANKQRSEIDREDVIEGTPSLPSDSGETRDQDSFVKTPITSKTVLRLENIVDINMKTLGHDHPDTLAGMANLASTYVKQGRWDEAEALEVQVMETFKTKLGADHPDTLSSMANLASRYRNQGRLEDAEALFMQVIETRKTKLGADHPDTLISMTRLAFTYSDLGRLEDAEALVMQVMETFKTKLGADHPDTLVSMANLASIYWNQGRWDEAEALFMQVIETRKTKLGADHPDTLSSMANLASRYRNQGRLEDAEALFMQVIETRKTKLGADHPSTLSSMANLASTYRNQGRWNDAEALEVQVMESLKTKLGADHPDTLSSMANLASRYRNQGRLEDAEALFMQVIETRKTKLGADHPDTLSSMANLASTYRNQGRWDEAEALFMQVMETRKTKLGADHPDTLTSMANLASIYRNQGRWDEAEALLVQVMETFKTKLGVDHPDTLASMANLAFAYSDQGRLDDAEALQMQVMESRKAKLGADHPSTLTSMANLASTYRNQGRWNDAEALEVQVMETFKTKLGADHPSTLTSMANLASTYRNQGRWNDAEALEVQVMESLKTKLGADHPDTLSSMANLASRYRNQGRLEDAEALLVQVMESRKMVLGEDHPETMTSIADLAYTRKAQGLTAAAVSLMSQCLQQRLRALGASHPDVQSSLAALEQWKAE